MFQLAVILHLLGAAVWTGGHLVLSLTVLPRALRQRDPRLLTEFEAGYERVGIPALLLQVVSGLWLAHRLLPDPGAWFSFDSMVATHIAAKLILLIITLGLALHARLRVLPRLGTDNLWTLAWHVIAVTVISVLLVLVGAGFRTGGIL